MRRLTTRTGRVKWAAAAAAAALAWGTAPAARAADDALRTVNVTVAADSGFRSLGGWRETAREMVETAGRDLPGIAGLRLAVASEREWDPSDPGAPLGALLSEASDTVPRGPGILMVLLGPRPHDPADPAEQGYAYPGEPALVVRAPYREEARFRGGRVKAAALLIRHELGHVFGIPHLEGRNVMAASDDRRSWEFPPVAAAVLRAGRTTDFGPAAPFAGADLTALRDAYLFWDGEGEGDLGLLNDLGSALLAAGRAKDARTIYATAIRRAPRSVPARVGAARAAWALGESARARSEADSLAAGRPVAAASLWAAFGDTARAESLLDRAATAGEAPALAARGRLRLAEGRCAGAAADFRAALELEDRADTWFDLGAAALACGDRETARRALATGLVRAPAAPGSREARERLKRLGSTGTPAARGRPAAVNPHR